MSQLKDMIGALKRHQATQRVSDDVMVALLDSLLRAMDWEIHSPVQPAERLRHTDPGEWVAETERIRHAAVKAIWDNGA